MGSTNWGKHSITLCKKIAPRIRAARIMISITNIPLLIFWNGGWARLQGDVNLLKSFSMFSFGSLHPLLALLLRKSFEQLFVDRTAKSRLLFCRYTALPHPFIEDWVDDTAIFGAPDIVTSLLARSLKAVSSEFGH